MEDETGWKLVSYILMMLGWRSLETPRQGPGLRSKVWLEMWIWELRVHRQRMKPWGEGARKQVWTKKRRGEA